MREVLYSKVIENMITQVNYLSPEVLQKLKSVLAYCTFTRGFSNSNSNKRTYTPHIILTSRTVPHMLSIAICIKAVNYANFSRHMKNQHLPDDTCSTFNHEAKRSQGRVQICIMSGEKVLNFVFSIMQKFCYAYCYEFYWLLF